MNRHLRDPLARVGHIRVKLACGCWIRVRIRPQNPVGKYMCRSGMGHSYNQPWVAYEDDEQIYDNPGSPEGE